jgi:hypothetical protein
LCPPFDGAGNKNLFGCHFGIEFHADNHTFVRAFLPFIFPSCFGLSDDLWYRLAHQDNWYVLNAGIPALTLAWVFDHILHCLVEFAMPTARFFNRIILLRPPQLSKRLLAAQSAFAFPITCAGLLRRMPTLSF